MDSCITREIERDVYLHEGRVTVTSLLRFQPGDVLGMLVRQERSSGYIPLVADKGDVTGFNNTRLGPYPVDHMLPPVNPTQKSPLFSLQLC